MATGMRLNAERTCSQSDESSDQPMPETRVDAVAGSRPAADQPREDTPNVAAYRCVFLACPLRPMSATSVRGRIVTFNLQRKRHQSVVFSAQRHWHGACHIPLESVVSSLHGEPS